MKNQDNGNVPLQEEKSWESQKNPWSLHGKIPGTEDLTTMKEISKS